MTNICMKTQNMSERIQMKKINNLQKTDFDIEIEEILKNEKIIAEDAIAYEDNITANIGFSSDDEKKEYIEANCVCFYDDDYVYICADDSTGDYRVERRKLKHHSFLLPIKEETVDDIVEFSVISKENSDITISGYAYTDSFDDDEIDIIFYNNQGLEAGHYIPSNPYNDLSDEWKDYELIKEAFQTDDLFIQFLYDYGDENRTVDRGDYLLKINEGASFELIVEDYESPDWDTQFHMCFQPKYNGKPVEMDEDRVITHPYTGEEIQIKTITYDYGYILEVPKNYWDADEKKQKEIIKEFVWAFEDTYNEMKGIIEE